MKRFTFCLLILFGAAVIAGPANATMVSVTGPNSSLGTAPAIIAAPSDVLEDVVTNTGMQGFDEAQGVLTTAAYAHDSGVIPIGARVNSHMIFLNSEGETALNHWNVVWTFVDDIVAVMSDTGGTYEAASTAELGAVGTNYTVAFGGSGAAAPFELRGLEADSDDAYVVDGNKITVTMAVFEPGDWIRVVTMPEPATLLVLIVSGLLAMGTRVLRKHRTTA